MRKNSTSIRFQITLVTLISILILSVVLVTFDLSKQQSVLINSERRVGLTLILSVNNTITSVKPFISTLSDIAELDTRLSELVQLNDNIDFIAVTDVTGTVIFHSEQAHEDTRVEEIAQLPENTTVLRSISEFGEVYLTSLTFDSSDLDDPEAYQIVIASASEPIRNQIRAGLLSSVLVTAIFALATAIVIILLMQHYFVRPLEYLTDAAEAIEAGDLTREVTIEQRNEIGQLARSFNRMTRQLTSSINTLEERVRERTSELEIARDKAELASRAKSDFLSNMSHELRTPLNMVIGYTSSMLTMPEMYNNVGLPEIYRSDIELIQDNGRHLLTLINDVLDLSKVEAGKLELHFSAVDLNAIFDSVMSTSLGLIGDKPIQIRRKLPR